MTILITLYLILYIFTLFGRTTSLSLQGLQLLLTVFGKPCRIQEIEPGLAMFKPIALPALLTLVPILGIFKSLSTFISPYIKWGQCHYLLKL